MTPRWCRYVLRLVARTRWHWEGILWWIVRRRELRGLPLPWPAVETADAYEKQTSLRISAGMLSSLIELRSKMGFRTAFLENDVVTKAIEIAAIKPGAYSRARAKAKEEEIRFKRPLLKGFRPDVGHLLGPKGGLPRTKTELQMLARALGLEPATASVDQLKTMIRPLIEANGPPPVDRSAKCGSQPSAESEATDTRAWELVHQKETHHIQAIVAQALQNIHGDAPPEVFTLATTEAMKLLEDDRSTRQSRLTDYFGKDVEM